MRIHNEIWSPPSLRKRHILFRHNEPTHSLLAMPTRQFITKFWPPHFSGNRFDNSILIIVGQDDSIDIVVIAVTFKHTGL